MQNRFVSWLFLIASILIGSSLPIFADCSASPCALTNSNPIALSATASASALDTSTITVTGFSSTSSIAKATVTLNNWAETDGGNVNREFFLVYTPGGSSSSYSYQFLSGLGDSNGFSNVTIMLDDGALAGSAPVGQTVASNNTYTYLPTVATNASYSQSSGSGLAAGTNNFAAPFGTATFASVFGGLPANGTWTLYVYDASSGDAQASIAGGWTITVTAAEASTTNTSVTASAAEAFIGDNITFAATVANTANSSLTVSEGTVTFTDTTTGIALGSSPVSNGTAILDNVTFSTEGNHIITAQYNGDANFGVSSSSVNVFLDHATSIDGPTFCNTGLNFINTMSGSAAGASVYPQHVFVSGLTGSLTGMSLQLSNLQNVVLPDLNVLLVGPSGTTQFVALAGAGGGSPIQSGTSLTLSDFGGPIPISGVGTGPYLPADASASVVFGLPAPAGPYALAQPQGSASFATTFASELNGAWSLYVYDSRGGDSSKFGGYCLAFTTSSVAASTTVLNASAATAMLGEQITFTAAATSNGSPVTGGTVTFKENGQVVSGPTAVDANGAATYQTSSLAEGVHTLTAVYSGILGAYNVSSASASVEVDAQTAISGPGVYCNPGGITFSASGSSTPYPSRVNVTNLPGTVNAVTVTLNGLTNTDPSGIGMLLTGPSATNIVLWKEAGGPTAVNGDNITLDDAAGSTNSIAFPLPASGSYTYFPTAATANGAFPAPAPANASYAPPAGLQTLTSAFQNLNGNGYWSLYTSGAAAQTGSIGSWCLNFTQNPPVLSVAVSGPTTLTQGQTGAQYTITATNNGPGPTGGATPISVSELPGAGLTVTGMNGTGWDCSNLPVCTSTAVMPQGATSTITATISVSNSAGSPQTNSASASGGGSLGTVTDPSPLSIMILAPTTTVASNASVAFSPSAQTVLLSAAVSANGPTVNGGTVTFSVLNGGTQIGVAVTSGMVANGSATAAFVLPAGAAPGTYTIQAMYNGAGNFVTSSDSAHSLTVSAASTTITAANASPAFSSNAQNVTLSATVTSAAGQVNSGSITFAIFINGTQVGSPVTSGTLVNGSASAVFVLPAGTAVGTYSIQATYNGAGDFASSNDSAHSLNVGAAATTITVANAPATFSANAQNVTLSATVTSAAGTVNSGTVSFTVFNSGTPVGNPVTSGTVTNGVATATYSLPAGTAAGSYSISASYTGGGNFAASSDSTHSLAIGPAATTVASRNATTTFSPSAQNIALSASVTSTAGAVNDGAVTFTILNGSTPVGSAVTSGTVTGGSANATYSIPAGTAAGTYVIQATYNPGGNFAGSSDNSHNLSVNGAATAIAPSNASATFSPNTQNVILSATVTSAAGTVNAGTVTFTLLNGGNLLGSPITSGTVANGIANATFSLPAGTLAGTYTMVAVYNAGWNFVSSSDATHSLTVSGAVTTTLATGASAIFNPSAQNVTLFATVTSTAGTVNAGTVTFTILNNSTTIIGTPATSATLSNGSAVVSYSLPPGTAAGTYVIQVAYSGGGNFAPSTDGGHALMVGGAATTISAGNASINFNTNAQNVTLSAIVTSAAGTVNSGTVTFTVLNGSTAIGLPVTSPVVASGAATVTYSLPAGTVNGTYTIQAVYNAAGNFTSSSDTAHSLIVSGPTTTVGSNASAVYGFGIQNVMLSATVTSTAGVVNAGTVTFSVYSGATLIGAPAISGTVANGAAGATYSVPTGTAAGTYTIQAAYNGGGIFAASSDSTHTLIVNGALTTTRGNNVSTTFNPNSQTVALSATVSSAMGPVNAGTVTFTVLSGDNPLGSPVTVNTFSGNASATYTLPGALAAGTYSIQAIYNGGGNFAGSADNTGVLTVGRAATTVIESGASATFSPNSQSVTLSATVLSVGIAVNGGTVTFIVSNNGTALGSPVTSGTVAGGTATATYSVPGGAAIGTYTIQAVYNGGGNFAGSSDNTQLLTVGGAATVTSTNNIVAAFSASAQNVTLSTTVTSTAGIVNSGSVSFTVLTPVASTVTGNVVNGSASVTYSIPAGTAAGTYTIQAVYNAGGNFAISSDVAHILTISTAPSTTAASNVSATFGSNAQNLTLSAEVNSAAGVVNSGTVTFTVLNFGTPIGSAVTSGVVSNGNAGATYSLPGGTPEGTYSIQAIYSGGGNFAASSETAHTVTVGPAATTILGSAAIAGFSPNAQNVTFSATVTSTAGTVNTGTVTFTLLNGGMPVGTPVTSSVVTIGHASVTYLLPGGTGLGMYTILAAYNAGWDFTSSSDATHSLTVLGAATTIAANNASATFSANAQNVTLSAAVASAAGTVNGGTVTFTVWNGTTEIGVPAISTTVANGTATATYVLPANTPAATYEIQAAYSGSGSFAASSDAPVTLTVMAQSGALMFVPVTPCRVVDTRNATGPFGGPQMTAGSTRTFAIPASSCGIPSTALAYSLNTTVIPSAALGYLTMWPAGQAQPNVSTLNSFDGRIKANAAIVPAGTNGAVSIYVTDATHVVLDIDGYYVPAGTPSSLAFYPMTPCRVADTRQGTGPLAGPSLGGGSSRMFPILSSSCNIPSTAQAYSMNFTAVPAGPLLYLTTWATGTSAAERFYTECSDRNGYRKRSHRAGWSEWKCLGVHQRLYEPGVGYRWLLCASRSWRAVAVQLEALPGAGYANPLGRAALHWNARCERRCERLRRPSHRESLRLKRNCSSARSAYLPDSVG